MICPNCKQTIAGDMHTCGYCGFAIPDSHESLSTTALNGDYSDFYDTIVDQVGEFDPSAFGEKEDGQTQQSQQLKQTQKLQWTRASQAEPQPTQSQASVQTKNAATAPANTSASAQPASTASLPDSRNGKSKNVYIIGALLGVAGVAIVVVIILLLFFFGIIGGRNSTESSSTPAGIYSSSSSSSTSQADKNPGSSSASDAKSNTSERENPASPALVDPGDGRELTESKFYDLLTEYYKLAGSYDKDVSSCASSFNSDSLKEDRGVRNADANKASTLKAKIKTSWDEAKGFKVPFMSKNTQAHKDICELYECLWHRIDVIDRAWKISLQYDKPAEHQTEITAPIDADRVGDDNKYYTRFKELYPRVNLVKP